MEKADCHSDFPHACEKKICTAKGSETECGTDAHFVTSRVIRNCCRAAVTTGIIPANPRKYRLLRAVAKRDDACHNAPPMTKPRKDNVARLSRRRSAQRARGWFFAEVETRPYQAWGDVFGQARPDSCVATCCRMLLADVGIEQPEAFIRDALKINEGAFLSLVPATLRAFGLHTYYEYRRDLTWEHLRDAINEGSAIVYVAKPGEVFGHALVVDEITADDVGLRDPLPINLGRAYRVARADFLSLWLDPQTGFGRAVIVID